MSAPNVVVIGGFSETRGAMERFADTAEDMGIWGHTEAFTLPEVWNQDAKFMDKLAQADELAGHSSWIVAVAGIARNIGGNVRGLSSFNGPEMPIGDDGSSTPWTRRQLVAASSQKTRGHISEAFGDIMSPGSVEEARLRLGIVIGNGLQVAARPRLHWQMLNRIRNFSTAAALREASAAGINKLNDVNSEHDEFFPPELKPLRDLKLAGAMLKIVGRARHDDVITDPRKMLRVSRGLLER